MMDLEQFYNNNKDVCIGGIVSKKFLEDVYLCIEGMAPTVKIIEYG